MGDGGGIITANGGVKKYYACVKLWKNIFKTNIKKHIKSPGNCTKIKQNWLSYRPLTLQNVREEDRSQNHRNISSHLVKLEAMPKSKWTDKIYFPNQITEVN